MIKLEKGEVKINGIPAQVLTELLLICAALKKDIPEKEWEYFAKYWVEVYADARIYETKGVTEISKNPRDLTIALAFVLWEISKRHPEKRDRIIKMAFEIGADLEQNGQEALLEYAKELDKLEESK